MSDASSPIPPSWAGVAAYQINAAPFSGYFDWWQVLAPGEDQSHIPPPLMITQINHGVVYEVPADPDLVVPAEETFAIAPERS